jgi:D-mannonate dehydratase
LVQPAPLNPAVGVTVEAVTVKEPVTDSRVVVMVVDPLFPVIEVVGLKLTVHVEDPAAVFEPGVKTTVVTEVAANAGVAKSVRPPSNTTALKAAFTHT